MLARAAKRARLNPLQQQQRQQQQQPVQCFSFLTESAVLHDGVNGVTPLSAGPELAPVPPHVSVLLTEVLQSFSSMQLKVRTHAYLLFDIYCQSCNQHAFCTLCKAE